MVTGTAGLGAELATQLVKHRPRCVYFTGRNQQGADTLIQKHPDLPLRFIKMDQTSLANVSVAATQFNQLEHKLDILICNAGVLEQHPGTTKDGYELNFGVNHLSHALLIKKLLPLLYKSSSRGRVVILSSTGYQLSPLAGIVFEQLKSPQDDFGWLGWTGLNSWFRYGQSKLANLLYAKEMARHHPDLITVAVHPGVFNTHLTTHISWPHRLFLAILTLGDWCDVQTASQNPLWAATTAEDRLQNGYMYLPVGRRGLGPLRRKATDSLLAQQLWSWTEEELEKY